MRNFLRNIAIAIVCGAISVPMVSAQRHRENHNSSRTERATNRGSNTNYRPNINTGNSNSGNHNSNNRPNINPGNNKPGNDRPNIGNNGGGNNNHRPGGNHGFTPGSNHGGVRPGTNHGFRPGGGNPPAARPPYVTPPHRPYRPAMHRPHYRPMPPRGWRPAGRIPVIRGILGLTFGTAINISLNYLINSGYNVDGYTNDVVYLRNVSAMNYVWTDAALYYGSNGLDASSFYYSTPGYDLARYNNVYNSLVATYGVPVTINNNVNSMGATWFGGNQGYITLSFGANNTGNGLRYLTTLTFGL